MKKLYLVLFLIFASMFVTISCTSKESESIIISSSSANDSKRTITKEMAYSGINNYCHITYDWSIAKDNPSIMSVEMGEETAAEYQVIFKSYTGSFVYFYVDKSTGTTRMVDYVPDLDIREESGTINLLDYLGN